ncbi:MAG: phosphate ABC transporter permease subunit PstC [Candidatus Omnitrophica bacterium]|nr:phosphate ABC transporter permease subunit PstC [Candidatus Omnitrophota bacterium]
MKDIRLLKDTIAARVMFIAAMVSSSIVVIIAVALYMRSRPILAMRPLGDLLLSTAWHPSRGEFGFLGFIVSTLWVTVVACSLAIPVCALTSVYLVEYADKRVREWISPFIDILAGIPSVIYGIWGALVIVPLIKGHIAPFFGTYSAGYSVLAGGIVLAVMIVPVMIHVMIEVLSTVPRDLKDASLALGATKWQTVKHVVLKCALPGMSSAVVLGLSRAFGETIAVLMVVGNVARIPRSVFDPAYPLPALIANNYGEMLSIPLYDSALLFAALLLLAVVIYFNIVSRMLLRGAKWSVYYNG